MVRFDFRPHASIEHGVWWPSEKPDEFCLHLTCPFCGGRKDLLQHRVIGADGRLQGDLPCVHGNCTFRTSDAVFLDYDPVAHAVVPGAYQYPVRSIVTHRLCGTRITLTDETARLIARDPRCTRGHWCPGCNRHALNHELFFDDGHMVGEGWFGKVRYSDMPAEERARIGCVD